MKQVAVLLSGGVDSTSAVALAARDEVLALTISMDYGQRHVKELAAARAVADHFEVPNIVVDLHAWGSSLKGSALTDPDVDVPRGAYSDANMALTVVPNRNATFLMAAAGLAQTHGVSEVWTAVHAGDHMLYADCRPEFIESASRTAELGTDGQVRIRAPFVHISKAEIIQRGAAAGAPLNLTWSCYRGEELHCGVCGTCIERREAFAEVGITDTTMYKEAR